MNKQRVTGLLAVLLAVVALFLPLVHILVQAPAVKWEGVVNLLGFSRFTAEGVASTDLSPYQETAQVTPLLVTVLAILFLMLWTIFSGPLKSSYTVKHRLTFLLASLALFLVATLTMTGYLGIESGFKRLMAMGAMFSESSSQEIPSLSTQPHAAIYVLMLAGILGIVAACLPGKKAQTMTMVPPMNQVPFQGGYPQDPSAFSLYPPQPASPQAAQAPTPGFPPVGEGAWQPVQPSQPTATMMPTQGTTGVIMPQGVMDPSSFAGAPQPVVMPTGEAPVSPVGVVPTVEALSDTVLPQPPISSEEPVSFSSEFPSTPASSETSMTPDAF